MEVFNTDTYRIETVNCSKKIAEQVGYEVAGIFAMDDETIQDLRELRGQIRRGLGIR